MILQLLMDWLSINSIREFIDCKHKNKVQISQCWLYDREIFKYVNINLSFIYWSDQKLNQTFSTMLQLITLFVCTADKYISLNKTMKTLLLLTILLIYTNTISYSSSTISTLTNNLYAPPTYPLGSLISGATLTVNIQLPNGGSLSSFSVKVRNSNNSVDVATLSGWSGATGSTTWNVSANATYNLQVSGGVQIMYYLTATINNTITLLRITDILRTKVSKFFFVPTGQTSPIFASIYPSDNSNSISFFTSSPSAPLTFTSATSSKTANVNGADNFTLTVTPGKYYLIQFTLVTAVTTVVLVFPSSTYPCIYANGFNDYYGTFTSCSGKSSSLPGLPCQVYDYGSQSCSQCISGYSLANGQCILPVPCTSRQYYRFGVCYDANPNCDTFDAYTGDCTSCLSPTQYKLVNNTCVFSNTLVCKDGTYLYGNICISNTCSMAFNNGSCTACISTAFYLSNGNCLPINCGTNSYFSVKFNTCATIPFTCFNFSVLSQNCQTCTNGYFLQNGVCLQPYGSANCKTWSFQKSVCAQCLVGYSLVLNLCQINILTPISCPSGQYLVNKVCVNLPPNCLALNNFYICTQCAVNYQIAFGQCVPCKGLNPIFPCVYCKENYFVTSTGSCQQVNQYCKTSNPQTGLCLTCTSGALPVNGICCSSSQSVQNGICVNNSSNNQGSNKGQGIIKDSKYYQSCLYYNSACDCCTQCRNGRYFDYSDHCA